MKMKKIVKIVFIGLSVLIIVLTICIIIWLFHQKSDISDVPNQISVSSGNQISSTINMEEDLEWYDTLDEAKQDVSIIKKNENYVAYRSQTTEIIQKKYEDRLIYFYLLTEEGLDDSSVKADAFAYMIFKIKDNQISQPYWIESYNLEVGFENSHYTYDFDDSVVAFIIKETVVDILEDEKDGFPIYFGTWVGQEVEGLTIDGIRPEVVPVKLENKTYYFWFYLEAEWKDKVKKINWSDFTYQQIIDQLKIRY